MCDSPARTNSRMTAYGLAGRTLVVVRVVAERKVWRLLLASFLVWFAELAFIRWIAVEVRSFAYFKNLAPAALPSRFRNGMRVGSPTSMLEQGGHSAVGVVAFGSSAVGSGRATRKSLAKPGRRSRHEYLGHGRWGECVGIFVSRRSFLVVFCVDRVGVRAPGTGRLAAR